MLLQELLVPSERRIRLKTSRLLLTSDGKNQKLLQAAAVCYRWNSNTIEFLLVRTRGGRWTFPKGGIVPGYSSAESAALEAMEEAGVRGRIERTPFARYRARKHAKEKSSSVELTVQAHLCEVLTTCPPEETGRRPTWFYRESAKKRLREDRLPMDASELERVVNQAASRIQRLRNQLQAEPRQKAMLRSLPKAMFRSCGNRPRMTT
jgi:8-oxo-dGTP pyrophosphatase MutT (NUDIX family)